MNRSHTVALVIASIAALNFAVPATAQPIPGAAGQPAPDAPSPAGGRGLGRPMTLGDYQARQRDRILRADADHDGRVSLSEWMAYQAERREGSGGEGRGGHWGGGGLGGDPAHQFQTMDANHDGYLTPAEIDAASADRFARMDSNHDGVVTPDERRAMRGGGEPAQPSPQ